MQMTPFFSLDGMLIGHVDVSMCRQTRNSVVIDNGPNSWSAISEPIKPEDPTVVEMYHIPLREIQFRCGPTDAKVCHLVVDEKTLPSWFWGNKAVVTFVPHSWQRVQA